MSVLEKHQLATSVFCHLKNSLCICHTRRSWTTALAHSEYERLAWALICTHNMQIALCLHGLCGTKCKASLRNTCLPRQRSHPPFHQRRVGSLLHQHLPQHLGPLLCLHLLKQPHQNWEDRSGYQRHALST